MLFPTHLIAAGLVGRGSRLPTPWLVAGAAMPDIVDKPLAMAGVTNLYHSVGHSALLGIVVVPVALNNRTGLAVAVGWGSHLLLDALHVAINGRFSDALFLAWPVRVPPDPLKLPPGAFVRHYLWSPSFYVEVLVWIVLLYALVRRWRVGRTLHREDQ